MWFSLTSREVIDMLFDVQHLPHGCCIEYPLDFDSTTENATQIGSQKATPSSVNKIEAERKKAQSDLDLAGEQRDDDQVVAVSRFCNCLRLPCQCCRYCDGFMYDWHSHDSNCPIIKAETTP